MKPSIRQWAERLTRTRRERFEERAAIMEFEGDVDRDSAEEGARRDCVLWWGERLGILSRERNPKRTR